MFYNKEVSVDSRRQIVFFTNFDGGSAFEMGIYTPVNKGVLTRLRIAKNDRHVLNQVGFLTNHQRCIPSE
jgi:hypothetical protein